LQRSIEGEGQIEQELPDEILQFGEKAFGQRKETAKSSSKV